MVLLFEGSVVLAEHRFIASVKNLDYRENDCVPMAPTELPSSLTVLVLAQQLAGTSLVRQAMGVNTSHRLIPRHSSSRSAAAKRF